VEHWLAGLTAAALAWSFNRYLVAKGGDRAVIWLIPPLEEILKTGAAIGIGTAVPLVHGVFGLLEAIHDYWASPRWGFWAGLSSIGSHYFFGWATLLSYRLWGSWLLAILLVSAAHILGTLVMVGYLTPLLSRRRS